MNMLDNNNDTRRFSYAEPILYRGNSYPSARTDINDNGITREGRIFADANGEYYTLDSKGNALPAMLTGTLPEVEVTPSREEALSTMFNGYLTRSDKTRVNNVPHREYNPWLRESSQKGAREHALWDKEHPNLAAWRDLGTAIPFGVAAIPLAEGLGETAIGQAAIGKVKTLMTNPLVETTNSLLGFSLGVDGIKDISQGNFTPDATMKLMGLPIGLKSEINVINKLRRNTSLRNAFKETPISEAIKKEGAKRYTDFINSQEYSNRLREANLENHWEKIKRFTDERLNGKGHFPGRNQEIVYNNPETLGLSSSGGNAISNPYYGISLKNSLYPNKVMPTLDHEIAHWATKSAGPWEKGFLGDMMTYNESITPNLSWENVLWKEIQSNPSMTLDRANKLEEWYRYAIDPQEKRARAMSIYQQAKDNNMTTDEFVDLWTNSDGKIYSFAPEQLRDMATILTRENLKKYLNKFLGISAPIGLGITTLNNRQNGQGTFRR